MVNFLSAFQIFLKLRFADAAEGDEVHVRDVRHDAVGALLTVVVVPAAKVDFLNLRVNPNKMVHF